MDVVIFCGGTGAREQNEHQYRPKPMLAIGEHPLIWHAMKHFSSFGLESFVLALGRNGDVIRKYFMNFNSYVNDVRVELGSPAVEHLGKEYEECGWRVSLVSTGDNSGVGSRLSRLEPRIQGDTFIAAYGDILTDVNMSELLQFHASQGKIATAVGVPLTSVYEALPFAEDSDALPKGQDRGRCRPLVDAGLFVLNRAIFQHLSGDGSAHLVPDVLSELSARDEVSVYKHHGFWRRVDTARDITQLDELWSSGSPPWGTWSPRAADMK